MKNIKNNIRYHLNEWWIAVTSVIAKRAIQRATEDAMSKALNTALREFHRARKLDWIAMRDDIVKLGEGMEPSFKDTDPVLAYKLGKQVALEAIDARVGNPTA